MIENHLVVSAHDVAQYIIASHHSKSEGGVSNMKLHKVTYFCQAYNMAFRNEPLFSEDVLAGNSGPIINEFFEYHKDIFIVNSWPVGDERKLSSEDKVIIDHVLKSYSFFTGKNMGEIAMGHVPWQRARQDSSVDLPVINLEVMRNFYRALSDAPKNPREYAARFMDRYENTEHL